MSRSYSDIIDGFSGLRLAVVGDAMVDRFLWGEVDRISPEAPVPVVRLREETVKLGGAANVAANVRALEADVTLVAACGTGETSRILSGLLADRGISDAGLLRVEGRRTTMKTRILAHNQQIVRADVEDDGALGESERGEIVSRLQALGPFNGVVLSDYGKGVLPEPVLREVIEWARDTGAAVVADPKNGDYTQYRGVTSLTPNQKEAGQATALTITDHASLTRAGMILAERTDAEAVLITRGEHGMALFERDGGEHHLPTEATNVFDVTGAGDTVIAVYTAALASGADFLCAANLANHAAGLAVRELGTVSIRASALREVMGS